MIYFNSVMKNKKGLSLVEIIIAMVVIATISVATFEYFWHCRRFILNTDLRLMAVGFARETIEELYWDDDLTETPGPVDDPLPAGVLGNPPHNGYRNYTVDNNSTNDYQIITITVGWN